MLYRLIFKCHTNGERRLRLGRKTTGGGEVVSGCGGEVVGLGRKTAGGGVGAAAGGAWSAQWSCTLHTSQYFPPPPDTPSLSAYNKQFQVEVQPTVKAHCFLWGKFSIRALGRKIELNFLLCKLVTFIEKLADVYLILE